MNVIVHCLSILLGSLMLALIAGCAGGSGSLPVPAGQPSAVAIGSPQTSAGAVVGGPAPDFELIGLDANAFRLSTLRGKPVMLNFWATWCPPCKEEMPDIEKAYQKYKDEGVQFVGVDMKENVQTVRDFVEKNGFHWTFVMDSDGAVSNDYLVSAIPTTYFVDRDGIVRDRQIGAMNGEILEAKLSKIR